MSDLISSLAALAERLGTVTGTAPGPAGVEEPTSPAVAGLTGILAMPLDQFGREGQCIEIRVSWHTETLWFVPGERDAAALGRDGVGRGRVCTAGELAALIDLPDLMLTTVRALALAKCAMDGDIVEVRDR